MDETDVDSYFYHNILDISQSHHRIVGVSKGFNKRSLAFKVFHFCDSKLQQRFLLNEEVSVSKKEIESLLDSLVEFLKAFDQANKVSQVTLSKPKFEIGFVKAKDEQFSHCCKDKVEHLNRQIRLSFWFETKKTCVFSNKKFEQNGDQFILTKVVKLGYRETKHTRSDFLLLTGVKFSRAIVTYKDNINELIGDVFCINETCNKERCGFANGQRYNPRPIYEFKKCKAWTLVRKFPFSEQ